MNSFSFSQEAWEKYLYWQTTDKKTLKKINDLLKEIARTPFDGQGKPEPLKGEMSSYWSRRINEQDRLVYKATENGVLIVQCKGHYND